MTKRIKFKVVKGQALGLSVYRGFGRLCDLARISRADVYDQVRNPRGTQRDLNRKHAREAYAYVASNPSAFYPEIVLNVRKRAGLRFTSACKEDSDMGYLDVDLDALAAAGGIVISRVDGNHRLYFADGHDSEYPPLENEVGFCVIYGLEGSKKDVELVLFRDINANQQGMNTSHLDNILLRVSTDLKHRDPSLYIAERLMNDKDSPFYRRVFQGGVKPPGYLVPLRTLKRSVEYLKSKSKKLDLFKDVDTQAVVIKNYWRATKLWLPEAWKRPRNYIALRATGFWALAFVGSEVVDRAVSSGKIEPKDMLATLRSGAIWDWSNSGDFRGYGGRDGAVQISTRVIGEFQFEGASIRTLEDNIRKRAVPKRGGGAARVAATTASGLRPAFRPRRSRSRTSGR
jgi:DGQHR domain-containing protein